MVNLFWILSYYCMHAKCNQRIFIKFLYYVWYIFFLLYYITSWYVKWIYFQQWENYAYTFLQTICERKFYTGKNRRVPVGLSSVTVNPKSGPREKVVKTAIRTGIYSFMRGLTLCCRDTACWAWDSGVPDFAR